jgi:uncharacterized protein (DUF2344 family)
MANESMMSVMASINKTINKIEDRKADMIEEDKTDNKIIADIIDYLEELEKIQDDYFNEAIQCNAADYHIKAISESRVLIAKIKETIKIMTSKNLFNKTTDSHDVYINYYCQDPSQYPTPNMEGARVEIAYRYKE